MNAHFYCSNASVSEASNRHCTRLREVVSESRERLIARYEEIAPSHSSLIRTAVAFAEFQAWETPFPHLLFPDFAEVRLAAVLPALGSRRAVGGLSFLVPSNQSRFMWIVRLALRRPYTFVVMSVLIVMLGVLAIVRTPKDIFPEIDIPVISVIWTYNGLSAQDFEQRITIYSEFALSSNVNDIERIESQTIDGVGIIRLHFHPGVKISDSLAQATAVSQAILRRMPTGVQPPIILRYTAASVPIVQMSLASKEMSEADLYDYGIFRIRTQIAVVNGITLPTPYGGTVRTVMVDLDPQALQAKGLSPRDVNDAINVQNLVLPSGRARVADVDYRVNLNNSPAVVDRLNDIPIKTVNGIPIYVRDVAYVHDGFATQTNVVRINGTRGTLLTILRNGNASTLDIVNGVKKLMPGIQASAPAGMNIALLFDQSTFVSNAIQSVLHEGLIAGCLTAAMILLFLGSWRSTLIVLISIPLSILTSVAVLSALGYSINVMTLGGLALAIGILVDDATVEIENIHRNLAMGKPLRQAILDGAQQIATPAFVATLAICIVFIPVVLLEGPAKYLFVPFALAVVFAVFTSYILSRTIVPVLVQYLAGPGDLLSVAGPASSTVKVSSNGAFSVSGLVAGTYVVTPEDGASTYEPANQTVVVSDRDVALGEFVRTPSSDSLSNDVVAAIDTLPEIAISSDTIVFDDGQTLSDFIKAHPFVKPSPSGAPRALAVSPVFEQNRVLAVKTMVASAWRFTCWQSPQKCDPPTLWSAAAIPTPTGASGPKQPAQTKLAYVYGNKSYPSERAHPTEGNCTEYKLLGFDCSGMMKWVASSAGISLTGDGNVAAQALVANWQFPTSLGLKVERVAYQNGDQVKAGDMLVWLSGSGNHIGIAIETSENPRVISSLGYSVKPKRATGPTAADLVLCEKNVSKGPKAVTLTGLSDSGMGRPIAVMRLSALEAPVANYSGDFNGDSTAQIAVQGCNGAGTLAKSFAVGLATVSGIDRIPTLNLVFSEGATCGQGIAFGTAKNVAIPLVLLNGVYSGSLSQPLTCEPSPLYCGNKGTQTYAVTLATNVLVPPSQGFPGYQTLKGSIEIGVMDTLAYDVFTVIVTPGQPTVYPNKFNASFKVTTPLEVFPVQ